MAISLGFGNNVAHTKSIPEFWEMGVRHMSRKSDSSRGKTEKRKKKKKKDEAQNVSETFVAVYGPAARFHPAPSSFVTATSLCSQSSAVSFGESFGFC